MSILKVKDPEGNIIDIPAIRGYSAYQSAVANGFEGTEAEWTASLKGEPGDDYVLTNADIAAIAATLQPQITELATTVDTNARDIDALQEKHAYAHYVFIDYTNADNTKKAIFTTLLVTQTAASYETSSVQAEQLDALWTDLRLLAGNVTGPHLMASGSFYGAPVDGAATRGYCISHIRNALTDAGTKQIWLIGYDPDRGLSGEAGIALVSIDTDSTGTVLLRDFVYQLI